jgi:diguanylate cyclase (GGDEF)-like protein/PAS domain S-box-containing protein
MTSPAMEQARRVTTCLLLFALVAGAGVLSKQYTRGAQGISTVWLANGLMLGYLLYAARNRWPELQISGLLGQVASGLLVGDEWRNALTAGLINGGEVLIAAMPLRATIHSARDLSLPRNFVRFAAWAVLAAPLISGLVLAGIFTLAGARSLQAFGGWYTGHVLGMATVVPVTLALFDKELARLFRGPHLAEVLGGLALIVIATVGVFWQNDYPLLYLIFPPMLLAAMRGGFSGTAFALLLVVAIAAPLTSMGHGPLMLKSTGLPGTSTYLLLQCFIATLLLTCFPVAVAMSAWRRNQNTERRLRHRLRLLADHSSDVIVLSDLDGRRLYVSPAVREMLGWEPEEFMRGSFRDLVPPSHMEAMEQQVAQLAANLRGKATITFPARRKDGRPLWVEARIKHFRDAGFLLLETEQAEKLELNRGSSGEEGFVVTLRDITRRRQAELALEDANRELASLVRQDSLTGLANRRHFDERLAECWERCLQAGKPLAVVLLDVDFFKRYNDHYGHQLGDQCLARVAQAIAGSLRGDADCAARYGGEEFALILPATSADEAQAVAERIRRSIERLALPHAASPYFRLTVSIGLASLVPGVEGKATEMLVKAADEALYASKTQGRNRVTAHDTLVPPVTEPR